MTSKTCTISEKQVKFELTEMEQLISQTKNA